MNQTIEFQNRLGLNKEKRKWNKPKLICMGINQTKGGEGDEFDGQSIGS